ncbi:hypothetical protein E0H26_21730 [Micromonospora zingiberis]|uniref:Uncharacterized protein n=1 Tax=Micromonospora zingiberis TaxID=2053011 RepID=A0A4R0GG28_9ACTN|nr:hypothetical protein [Micromonospora zingiberis]TCB94308.1 hypothetical protein E0H26_21730 [Micromonospora zingiberis]
MMIGMRETVAIALITSLSTLTAAGLTGLVTARTVRRQVTGQLAAAREERAEQRTLRRDQERRDTYVSFLAACDRAYRALDTGWVGPETAPGEEQPYPALRALDEAYNLVLLVGPDPAAKAAGDTVRSINEEYAQQRPLHREAAGPLATRHRTEHLAALRRRAERRDAFVTIVRTALGADRVG